MSNPPLFGPNGARYSNILKAIGNTPCVEITRLNPYKGVTILAKLECFNPGGSIKDRIALSMIEGAEKRGELTKDKIILEASSGNTGIGLSMVAAVKGYRCLITMSESASMERRQIMKAFGADILLTPAHLSTDGAIETAYRLAREEPEKYFLTDQFNNDDNWRAHYNYTALEIWEQTQGKVNAIVAAMGTTGTLMGLTRRFRELNSEVKIIGVEPYLGHRIQGLKNMKESYKPGIFQRDLPDEIMNIHDDEAFEMARRLAREEGIFVGMSSGAAMAAALKVAGSMESGVVVTIFPDGGERYLSTGLFQVPEEIGGQKETGIRLSNTLTRRKDLLEPLEAGKVKIYSCGPTVYNYAHLGLCRRVVVADLLRRTLESQGYQVTHVMNITDIDDKTIAAALSKGCPLNELTSRYTEAFMEDLETLMVKKADYYPRATEHIEDMVSVASRLMEKGFAYERHGSVYFDISKLSGYGKLSNIDISKIHVGKTVDLDDYDKDSPVDFTLFKRVNLQELKEGLYYDTPWGRSRPGWHIECVAMSQKYLGDFFDIHTSGCDLIFPHHENEIAMALALTHLPLAKIWLHSAMVLVDGKKMSRSSDNAVTLRDLLNMGYTGRQVRFFLLRTHYRKPLHYSRDYFEEALRALERLDGFTAELQRVALEDHPPLQAGEDGLSDEIALVEEEVFQALYDDLNVPKAIGILFGLVKRMNPLLGEKRVSTDQARTALEFVIKLNTILNVFSIPSPDPSELKTIEEMVARRDAARRAKRWEEADQIREQLAELGVEIMDTPLGPRWRKRPS